MHKRPHTIGYAGGNHLQEVRGLVGDGGGKTTGTVGVLAVEPNRCGERANEKDKTRDGRCYLKRLLDSDLFDTQSHRIQISSRKRIRLFRVRNCPSCTVGSRSRSI